MAARLKIPYALLTFITFFSHGPAVADELLRPSTLEAFRSAEEQKHFRLPDAKIVWVDFVRMRTDFPPLRELSDAEIEHWILEQFAYISKQQLLLRGIRVSHFNVDAENSRKFTHPLGYRRAAVAPAIFRGELIGLVDLKGSGHSDKKGVEVQVKNFQDATTETERDRLRTLDHSDGVASLGEGIAEVSKQRAIQAVHDLEKLSQETVENYFLIDPGFNLLKRDGEEIPGGIIGRQAHFRAGQAKLNAEGVYEDPFGGYQRSLFRSTVDFGGVIPTFPAVAELFKTRENGNPGNPQDSRAWAKGHEIARRFRARVNEDAYGARGVVYGHLEEMLGPLADPWHRYRSAHPGMLGRDRWRIAIDLKGSSQYAKYFGSATDPDLRAALAEMATRSEMFPYAINYALAAQITDPEFYRKIYLEIGLPAVKAGKLHPEYFALPPGIRALTLPDSAPAEIIHPLVFIALSLRSPSEILRVLKPQKVSLEPEVLDAFLEALRRPSSFSGGNSFNHAFMIIQQLRIDHPEIRRRLLDELDRGDRAFGSALIVQYLRSLPFHPDECSRMASIRR